MLLLRTILKEKDKILKLSEMSNVCPIKKPIQFIIYQVIYENKCSRFKDASQIKRPFQELLHGKAKCVTETVKIKKL